MAIKVNGTEVISNSRALNNIASVDATTAASMTAAGVGGSAGWEYVTTIDNTGTVAYIDYDFDTTYNHFMLLTSGWKTTDTYSLTNPRIRVDLKTDSGTLYTGNFYGQQTFEDSGYSDGHINFSQLSITGSLYADCPTAKLELWDVKDSTTHARYEVSGGRRYFFVSGNPTVNGNVYHQMGMTSNVGTFTGVRFYHFGTEHNIESGTKIKVWGML